MVKNSGELGIVEGLLYLMIVDIQERKEKKKSCGNGIENELKLMFMTVTFLKLFILPCILHVANSVPITYLRAVLIFFLLFLWFLQVFPFIVTVLCLSSRQGR